MFLKKTHSVAATAALTTAKSIHPFVKLLKSERRSISCCHTVSFQTDASGVLSFSSSNKIDAHTRQTNCHRTHVTKSIKVNNVVLQLLLLLLLTFNQCVVSVGTLAPTTTTHPRSTARAARNASYTNTSIGKHHNVNFRQSATATANVISEYVVRSTNGSFEDVIGSQSVVASHLGVATNSNAVKTTKTSATTKIAAVGINPPPNMSNQIPTTAPIVVTYSSGTLDKDDGGSENETFATQSQNATGTYYEMPQIPSYIRTTSMVFCITIMILGVIGNIMVPIVIIKTKDMRNSTNIFLTNLSIADLLVLLVCTPTVLVEVNTRPETWTLGQEMCKAVPFVELTVAHASVLTILAISFERYYAICEPLKAGYVCTKTRALLICVLAWGVAALFTSPILWVAEYKFVEYIDGSSVAVCLTQAVTTWTIGFFLMTISMFFIIPLIVLIILYGIIAKNLIANDGPMMKLRPTRPELSQKARKQVVLMLGAVVLSFFLCLLPFRVLTMWIILSSEQTFLDIGMEKYYNLLYFCRIMLYMNSAINPILYNLMSTKFRKGFSKLSSSWANFMMRALTFGQRKHKRTHGKAIGGGSGMATTNTTTSNATTTSSSILSRSSNRKSSEDVIRTKVQIQMQIPCGSDNEMLAMLHESAAVVEHIEIVEGGANNSKSKRSKEFI